MRRLLTELSGGQKPPDALVSSAMQEMDRDGDGHIDFDEFVHWHQSGAAAAFQNHAAITAAASIFNSAMGSLLANGIFNGNTSAVAMSLRVSFVLFIFSRPMANCGLFAALEVTAAYFWSLDGNSESTCEPPPPPLRIDLLLRRRRH